MSHRFVKVSFLTGLLWIISVFPAPGAVEDEHRWGVGLQGNFPMWGGLSVKYMGLGRLHLQAIEHYVQNGDEYSALIGLQTPVTVARYPWTKIYVAPGLGFRKTKEVQSYFVTPTRPLTDGIDQQNRIERDVNETTLGGALLFGMELFLDNIFSNSENSRYGLNIEFGQGFGQIDRKSECKDPDGNIVDCTNFPELQFLGDNPDEKEGTRFRASFVVGFGFHIYF